MSSSLNADGGTGLSGYSDTLAQSFFVDRNLQLTKIDLFYSYTVCIVYIQFIYTCLAYR